MPAIHDDSAERRTPAFGNHTNLRQLNRGIPLLLSMLEVCRATVTRARVTCRVSVCTHTAARARSPLVYKQRALEQLYRSVIKYARVEKSATPPIVCDTTWFLWAAANNMIVTVYVIAFITLIIN